MPYVPLDDHFHSHRKVLAAGLEATGLHARALSWVGGNLTDGHVPFSADKMMCESAAKSRKLREILVNVGLRDKCAIHNDCSVIHDWGSINDPADELKAAREKERVRKQEWRRTQRMSRGQSQDKDGTRDGTVPGQATGQKPDERRDSPSRTRYATRARVNQTRPDQTSGSSSPTDLETDPNVSNAREEPDRDHDFEDSFDPAPTPVSVGSGQPLTDEPPF